MALNLPQMLEELLAMKYSGVLETVFEGRRVRYRDMNELDKAIADLKSEIAALENRPRPVARFATFRRST